MTQLFRLRKDIWQIKKAKAVKLDEAIAIRQDKSCSTPCTRYLHAKACCPMPCHMGTGSNVRRSSTLWILQKGQGTRILFRLGSFAINEGKNIARAPFSIYINTFKLTTEFIGKQFPSATFFSSHLPSN